MIKSKRTTILSNLLIVSLIFSFSCSKKNSPTQPENLSPIPLKVGNWWQYKKDVTSSFYKKYLIETKTTINGQEAYIVGNYWFVTSESRVLEFAWQWDEENNLFKEYLKDDGGYKPISAVKIPSDQNQQTEWGMYRTIYQNEENVMNYTDCNKYLFVRMDTGYNFYKWFKTDIGLIKHDEDILVDYNIQ